MGKEKPESDVLHTKVMLIITEMAPSPPAQIGLDMSLVAELGYDSIGILELISTLEDVFCLAPIEDEVLLDMETVSDVVQIVNIADLGQSRNAS